MIYRNKLLQAICKGDILFIKDTGVKVKVEYFGSDLSDYRTRNRDKREFCNIELLDSVTTKAIKLFHKYDIKRNNTTGKMELDAVIDIKNLSLTPYESKAGKLLYEKRNK
jgi:hypothetical protein